MKNFFINFFKGISVFAISVIILLSIMVAGILISEITTVLSGWKAIGAFCCIILICIISVNILSRIGSWIDFWKKY